MKFKTQKRKLVSMVVAFTFLLSLVKLPMTVVGVTEFKLNNYAVLVGNFQNWNPSDVNSIMTQITPDLFCKTVAFTNAQSYEYKVAMNGNWSESYGDGSNNRKLNITGPCTVDFIFDAKQKMLFDSINDNAYFKQTATIVGSLNENDNCGQSWNPADSSYDLTKLGNGFFIGTFSMKKGNYEYKTAYDHKWSNGEVGANVKLVVQSDRQVTFFSNPYANLCTNSIADSSILVVPSLIGTIRASDDNWNPMTKGFEFNYYGNGKYIFGKYVTKGSYEYKVLKDYKWSNGEIPGSNKTLSVTSEQGEYVVFVYDANENIVYDSINDNYAMAGVLGLIKNPFGPVINANGTVTFSYKDAAASSVSLRGTMNGWAETPMVKGADGIWTVTIRVGDHAANLEYKFFVNASSWIRDPQNAKISGDNSLLVFPEYSGRKVVIAGTMQALAGDSNWNPSSELTRMKYEGNGIYSFALSNVSAGSYEYKVAMGSWDPENYGMNGVLSGPNISMSVPTKQSVTFMYNDDSHRIVDSISYKMLDAWLSGGTLQAEVKLKDNDFTGLYRTAIVLDKGSYGSFMVTLKGTNEKTIQVPEFEVDARTLVTISYDPVTGFIFNDASPKKIETSKIIYDSRDISFKMPYGAVKQNESTRFSIVTGLDVGAAKLVLLTPNGNQILDMTASKGTDRNRFSTNAVLDVIGTTGYYFVLSNGSDIVVYGDDAKEDLGKGAAGAVGSVKNYTVNVYKPDFKTPDWMKNAVVYQIYPDRFFNGDLNNDYVQKYARGFDPYEFYSDWYSIPENPREEQKNLSSYVSQGGTVGDRIWSNEMYGGDIAGIKAKLDYLQALGVNVLYLNPVSASISNHRYDTTNYMELDPLLGYMSEYKELAAEVSRRGMHLIIDGVYNHVSDDSVYFDRYGKYISKGKPLGAYQYWKHVYDLVRSGTNIDQAKMQTEKHYTDLGIVDFHYKDWFRIDNVWISTDQSGNAIPQEQQRYQYEGWWGYDSMPIIQAPNGSELNVSSWKEEIIKGNTELWLGMGTGGYRLDVANEVSDETWKYFRDVVKAADKGTGDNVIIGEIWTDASKYLMGDMYDSVMNYRFREAVLDYLRDGVSGNDVNNTLEVIREQYPKEAFEAMMNLVDSHDTERILSDMDGMVKDRTDEMLAPAASEKAKKLQRLVPLIQMTYPGAPTIYYGDELGMVGAKDPDNRRAMIWGKGDEETLMAYAGSANIRNTYPVLRTGGVAPIDSINNNLLIYERYDNSGKALIVVNKGDSQTSVDVAVAHIPEGTILIDAMTGKEYIVSGGKVSVSLQAVSGIVLVTGYKPIYLDSGKLADGYSREAIVQSKLVPETAKAVIDRLKLPENSGKEVVVSTMSEEITKSVLTAAAENNVKPVIQIGNAAIVINNPKAVVDAITAAGKTGLVLTRTNEELFYKELESILKNKKYELFSFSLNLNDNVIKDFTVKISSTTKKPKRYVYVDKGDGSFEEGRTIINKSDLLTFSLNGSSKFIVTEVPIPQLLNNKHKNK